MHHVKQPRIFKHQI